MNTRRVEGGQSWFLQVLATKKLTDCRGNGFPQLRREKRLELVIAGTCEEEPRIDTNEHERGWVCAVL